MHACKECGETVLRFVSSSRCTSLSVAFMNSRYLEQSRVRYGGGLLWYFVRFPSMTPDPSNLRRTLLDPRATYTHYHIVANRYHVSNAMQ